jgi:hypothetical protein
MALPAILLSLGLTQGVWIAVMGLIRLITYVGGVVYVGSYVRDAVTKTKEADIVADRNDCVEAVLVRTDLSSTEKTALAEKCVKDAVGTDWEKIILYTVGILATAYVLSSYVKSR